MQRWAVLTMAFALTGLTSLPPAASARTPPYQVMDFTPLGARTAWTVVAGNQLHDPPQAILRTGNGGRTWSNLTPPDLSRAGSRTAISGLDALSPRRVWLSYGRVEGGPQRLLETTDGGRRWTPVGSLPVASCELQFVDSRHGWCSAVNGAAGSAFLTIYRTTSAGRRWRRVARNAPLGARPNPHAIPFACDKSISFTDPRTGFVSSYCNGGGGYVYRSGDGGVSWQRTLYLPTPRGGSAGAGFTPVVGGGSNFAVGYTAPGYRVPPVSIVFTSHNGGLSWQPVRPPGAPAAYHAVIVSSRVWLLFDGRTILATGDAGRSWRRVHADHDVTRIGLPVFTTASVGWLFDTNSDFLRRTSDGGRQWSLVQVPAP